MSKRMEELARELRKLDPDSRVLHLFPAPVDELVREDRVRAAFRRLTFAAAALIQRGECDE